MRLWAICNTCKHKHDMHEEAQGAFGYWQDWQAKHPGHDVGIVSENSGWKEYKDNADAKEAYASSADYTITLTSLASDTNLVAGRSGAAVSNTSNKYTDYLIGGKITTGTSPTASRKIEVWAYAAVKDTPTYPDVIDGTDANDTITSSDIKLSALRLVAVMDTGNTSDRTYWFGPIGIAQLFGRVPTHHGLFVVHNTGVNLNSTGSNHAISYTGHYNTVI